MNPLDTYFLLGADQGLKPAAAFLKDRYFGQAVHYATSKVLIEFKNGDAYAAPYVDPAAGWIPTSRHGRQIHEYTAPLLAPSRLLTMDDLQERGVAEALTSDKTPADRAQEMTIRDLAELKDQITRRKEVMAAELLTTNRLIVQEMVDREQKGQKFVLYFYDPTGSNPASYTGSPWTTWDTAKSHIGAMCEDLSANSLKVADLLLGTDVWAALSSMEDFKKDYNYLRANFGQLNPTIVAPGVSNPGTLTTDNGFMLNIFVIQEQFKDESDATVPMFDPKMAVVTAPDCGKTLFGAVTLIPFGSSDPVTFNEGQEEVPNVYVEHNTRELVLYSRPLPVPSALAPWRFTKALV